MLETVNCDLQIADLVIDTGGAGNYTEGEMEVALIVLGIILVCFFAVCTCQCYQKVTISKSSSLIQNSLLIEFLD